MTRPSLLEEKLSKENEELRGELTEVRNRLADYHENHHKPCAGWTGREEFSCVDAVTLRRATAILERGGR